MKYKITVNNKEYEIEQLSNGKFRKPRELDMVSCGVINIDGSRVPANQGEYDIRHYQKEDCFQNLKPKESQFQVKEQPDGRYPAQLMASEEAKEKIDKQSGIGNSRCGKLGLGNSNNQNKECQNFGTNKVLSSYQDEGGASRILHTCDFNNNELDYLYKAILKDNIPENIKKEINEEIKKVAN